MPTAQGRVVAALVGLFVGSYIAFDAMSDYQLIRRIDDPNERDENGNPIKRKFKVTFKPTSPLELKPEALEREKKKIEALQAAAAADNSQAASTTTSDSTDSK